MRPLLNQSGLTPIGIDQSRSSTCRKTSFADAARPRQYPAMVELTRLQTRRKLRPIRIMTNPV
jgi:hypothetical protein